MGRTHILLFETFWNSPAPPPLNIFHLWLVEAVDVESLDTNRIAFMADIFRVVT